MARTYFRKIRTYGVFYFSVRVPSSHGQAPNAEGWNQPRTHVTFTWLGIDELKLMSTSGRATVRGGVAVRLRVGLIRIVLDRRQRCKLVHDGRLSLAGLAVGGGGHLAADTARQQRQSGEDRQRDVCELAVSST